MREPGKLPVDPLKYRGVFDYPHNQSANLLPRTGNAERDALSKSRKIERSTSLHVVEFMGWQSVQGHKPKFTGEMPTASILSQQNAWRDRWVQWSWFEDGEDLFIRWWKADASEERQIWFFRAYNAFTKALNGPRQDVTKLAKDFLEVLKKGDYRAERRQAIKEAAVRAQKSAQRRASAAGSASEEF